MRVIAFDPSYCNTGYAVVISGPRLIAHGVIRPGGRQDAERFASLMDEIDRLCTMYSVRKAVVERPPHFPYGRSTDKDGKPLNLRAIQKNSMATSVILAALGRSRIKVVELSAQRWKICGGVNLGKAEMKDMARRIFPVVGKKITHHEAEAICMAALNV